MIPHVMFNVLWESIGEENEFSHAGIFEGKFGKKSERVITDSQGRTADALVMNLESVELAGEGSDLNIIENNFVPTARCTQDTKKKAIGDQIKSSETRYVVYAISSTSRQ